MRKNILVFIDRTGNEGGILPDESRTNVYKLYRATRSGPDSAVDPSRQVAFYIHGIGTPMRRIRSDWIRAVSGHAAATPPSNVMNSRRLIRSLHPRGRVIRGKPRGQASWQPAD